MFVMQKTLKSTFGLAFGVPSTQNADQNIQQEGCFVMPGKCFPTFSFPLKWVGGKPIKNHITDPKWQERGRI